MNKQEITPSEHAYSVPLGFEYETEWAFLMASRSGSIRADDRPLLLGKRFGRVQHEASNVAEGEFERVPEGFNFVPPIGLEVLEVVAPNGMGRHFDGLHRLDIETNFTGTGLNGATLFGLDSLKSIQAQ